MKKIQYCVITMLILCLLEGCTKKQSLETGMTPQEMVQTIMESQEKLPTLEQIAPEDEEFISYVSNYYQINDEQVEDGDICYADGEEASEIAVLVLKDEKDSETIQTAWKEYIQNRAGVFEGYAPQQAAMVKDGVVVGNGKYVALLICQDTSAAKEVFFNCFGENKKNSSKKNAASKAASKKDSKENASKADDAYDASAVLKAWKTGDDSHLSDMNLKILEAAKDVIHQEIKENMSDYEKELAIHDCITNSSSFDYSVFRRSSADQVEEGSDTPYGVLIDQKAMCHGYSSTFQLFMDMLDIECITVFGKPGSNDMEHSWNMVRLDGEWYCVDVAWDDPIGGSPEHTYFNVTSQELRTSGIHEWDETDVPEATATTYRYKEE
ncbi:MAG: DUF4358 domain-containing protein [Lachnospiraceae bacterium]|nr:DUF4358 domain-containing protein [Lachnospiraceae bacterium]